MVSHRRGAIRDSDAIRERHLDALSTLLRKDVLTGADWDGALRDTAALAYEALEADEALVAVWDDGCSEWRATTRRGDKLRGEEIRLIASRTVLDKVRHKGEAILTTAESPVLARTVSTARHHVHSVLAVPLRIWTYRDQPATQFGACLYVDRRGEGSPFTRDDVELVRDLGALAERTLSLVAHLRRVEEDLSGAREELVGARTSAAIAYKHEHFEPMDPGFVRSVIEPLRRAGQADRIGILLLGPTGSGKSHLARTFHYASRRREGPFIVLDCGQVTSSEALGAELFGYAERSGFSAPPEGRLGKARLAHGGTLFIDEVGALPLDLQQRLLALIQTGRFSPLGSAQEIAVDLRVVAAANQDLAGLVREGRFREDLYWRLAELVITVPPLDQHSADVPGLARAFLEMATRRLGRHEIAGFTPAALAALQKHPWSSGGNVRGLEHTISRSVLLAPAGTRSLNVEQISFAETLVREDAPRSATVEVARRSPIQPSKEARARLEERIAAHQGRLASVAGDPEVADLLGLPATPIPLSTLRLKLRQLGLTDTAAAHRAPIPLQAIVAAVREHGDGHAAAEALGLTRDQIAWRLRREGLTIRGLLRNEGDDPTQHGR